MRRIVRQILYKGSRSQLIFIEMLSKSKMLKRADRSVLVENAYLVEFDQSTSVESFRQRMFNSLQRSFGIDRSTVTLRQTITSSLFSGISFSINTPHSLAVVESIPGAKAVYPIYVVPGPGSLTGEDTQRSAKVMENRMDSAITHRLTGVDQVHEQLRNFGQGVRVRW